MSIHLALHHVPHYQYERPAQLGPQVIRQRQRTIDFWVQIKQRLHQDNPLQHPHEAGRANGQRNAAPEKRLMP